MPATGGDRFALHDRVAVVTGASSGLGAAAARALAAEGARVALVARRSDRIESLAEELGGCAVPCDLLDTDALDGAMRLAVEELGPPSILVNAAGSHDPGHRAEIEPIDAIDRTLRVNLVAPFLLAQLAFPHFLECGHGSVVNVSSISGIVGVPGIPQASYAASKAGLGGLTVELAMQWAAHRIRVNAVAPGFFRSDMTETLFDTERGAAWLDRNTPLPDQPTAEDMVGAILWLAGDASRAVTGQTIVVDAGWTAR